MRSTATFRLAQRGVASLIVVMVLLFVVALVAAYTSRNLIFEQRTSANQYRSTEALEASEAGLEWATAMLSQGLIDASCNAISSPPPTGSTSMRQRYLSISPTNGVITVLPGPPSTASYPTCVWGTGSWTCSCPSTTAPTLTAPSDGAVHPAFRIRFTADTSGRPGLVRVDVNGCTSLSETCLQFPSPGGLTDEGRARSSGLLALASGLAATPSAAVTAGGTVNSASSLGLSVYNQSPASGLTIQAHGAVTIGSMNLVSAPGTPSGSGTFVQNDDNLPGDDTERMFASVFNMYRSVYQDQPAAATLTCSGSPCSANTLRDLIALSPGRVIVVNGDLSLNSAGNVGSATSPVMIYVNGNVTIPNASVVVYGVIYSNAPDWSLTGSGTVQGALVAEGNLGGTSTATIAFDQSIVNAVRYTTGSFAPVPGGWRDFCGPGANPSNLCP